MEWQPRDSRELRDQVKVAQRVELIPVRQQIGGYVLLAMVLVIPTVALGVQYGVNELALIPVPFAFTGVLAVVITVLGRRRRRRRDRQGERAASPTPMELERDRTEPGHDRPRMRKAPATSGSIGHGSWESPDMRTQSRNGHR